MAEQEDLDKIKKDSGDQVTPESQTSSESENRSQAEGKAKSGGETPQFDHSGKYKDWFEYARAEGFDFVPEPRDPAKPPLVLTGNQLAGHVFSRVVLGLILFSAFIGGAWVSGTGLHDPDTCWLLALGRHITAHGAIPGTDPFSYTFALTPERHFVLYQWLAEVLFYNVTKLGGLLCLLMLGGAIIVTAFLSVPLSVAVRRKPPFLLALLAVWLGMASGSFHTLMRPEIFSFLFLSIYLQLLHHTRAAAITGEPKLFPIMLVAAPLMVLWCNMHTGFTSGFSVVAACLLGSLLGWIFTRSKKVLPLVGNFALCLVGMTVASLINPYNVGLWGYIPSLFFSRMNRFIIELAPLNVGNVIYAPFLILCVFYLLSFIPAMRRYSEAKKNSQREGPAWEVYRALPAVILTELLIALLMGGIGIYNAFRTSRLIPFVALILVGEFCALSGLKALIERKIEKLETAAVTDAEKPESPEKKAPELKASEQKTFWWYANHHSLDLWKTGGSGELAIVCFCALAGVALIASRVAPPELPAGSVAFVPPTIEAVSLVQKEGATKGKGLLSGNMFNDPQLGDVLIWLDEKEAGPKVFIDTRFDMYGDGLVFDFRAINECQPNWQELMEKYKIRWVFIKPGAPLALKLRSNPDWGKVLEEKGCIIMRRLR